MKNKIDVFEPCRIISLLPNPITHTSPKCIIHVVGKDSEYYLNFVRNCNRWELVLNSKPIPKSETKAAASEVFIDECTEISLESMKNIIPKSKIYEPS